MRARTTKQMVNRSKADKKRVVKRQAERKVAAKAAVYTVFISHSSKENWIAQQISKEIKALGAETWLDMKDLRGGDEIRRSIKDGIRESQEAVVLLSAHSVTSQWVIYEVGIADGQGKRITPILNNIAHDEVAPLQGIKAIDLNDFGNFLIELAGRIKKRLGKTRKAAV
jgi:hypothetical protein